MSRDCNCADLQTTIDRLALELAHAQRELAEARLAVERWRRVAQLIHEANTRDTHGQDR